jgi:hypothetical protein
LFAPYWYPWELVWLNAYHARVRREIEPILLSDDRAWLRHATAPIGWARQVGVRSIGTHPALSQPERGTALLFDLSDVARVDQHVAIDERPSGHGSHRAWEAFSPGFLKAGFPAMMRRRAAS